MTATFTNTLYEAIAHAYKKPGVVHVPIYLFIRHTPSHEYYVTHPSLNTIAIFQPACVQIREMWQHERDTIMYPLA